METVNLKTLHSLIPFFWEKKQPLALWGKPSTGKTSAFRQFAQQKAKELGLKYSEDQFGPEYFTFKTIIPSQFDPVDFIGLMKEKDGVTYFNPVASFPREGQGIFFIDEVSNADHTIIAPLQNLVLEGRLENYLMPDSFWRVCAGNESGDFCQTQDLSLAFYRRVAHLKVEPELDEVVQYFVKKGLDERVVAYLKRFPEDLFPKVWDERLLELKAHPFPYTWEKSAELIRDQKDLGFISSLVGAWVGDSVASRFIAFCKTIGKFSVEKVLKAPEEEIKKLEKDSEAPSLLYALTSQLVFRWNQKDKKLTPQLLIKILLVLSPEFATFLLKSVLQNKGRRSYLTKEKDFFQVLNKLGECLEE